jgi:hypothetical protein
MEELGLRWKSTEYVADWLISFYRERMLYFMENMGDRTEYNTVITPRLLMLTMKRYGQLLEEKHDIDRRLS